MALLDPAERMQRGSQIQQAVTTRAPAADRATLLQRSWRDFIYAEIWTRPGLDRRSRYLIAIASAAATGGPTGALDGYIRGALVNQDLSLSELREAALHLAVYTGWSRGDELDDALTRVANDLDLQPVDSPAIRGEPWDANERIEQGINEFDVVMGFPGPPPVTPYFEAGIDNFVFGEMWKRPGLDQRSRRWVTLVGVSESCAATPIKSHFFAALASGNCTPDELQEFVLQYAVHGGWPKASVIQGAVLQMIKNHAADLPWDA